MFAMFGLTQNVPCRERKSRMGRWVASTFIGARLAASIVTNPTNASDIRLGFCAALLGGRFIFRCCICSFLSLCRRKPALVILLSLGYDFGFCCFELFMVFFLSRRFAPALVCGFTAFSFSALARSGGLHAPTFFFRPIT